MCVSLSCKTSLLTHCRDGGDSPATMETSFDPETVPLRNLEPHNDLSRPYDRQESIENDGFPPLPSTFSFNLGSETDLTGCDVDVDAERLSHAGQVPDSCKYDHFLVIVAKI